FRTNTLIKSGLYAGLKVDDYAVKEKGSGHGWTLTTKDKLFPGNTSEFNPDGRGEFINVDAIRSAFGVTGAASGTITPKSIGGALKHLRDAVMAANDA